MLTHKTHPCTPPRRGTKKGCPEQDSRPGWRLSTAGILGFLVFVASLTTFGQITSPAEFLGHEVGADYKLARWEKIVEFFQQLDSESDRVQVRELGKTTEGMPMILAEISAAETVLELPTHQTNQHRLADPRLITEASEEKRLISDSKVAILVNCNLHSSETASSQMAMELAYELASSNSQRIREILDRVILLLVPSANPDGLNKVIDWYERTLGKPWEGTGMPWLYQKYAGHDNNRDWFMQNLQETKVLTRVLYREWFPTIVYDVHQMGNRSARFFVPPFHDPKNVNVHPLIDQSLLIIGGHMASELSREGKKGVVHGAMYDNWWAGGFRTTPYRHNMVGILTEAASPLLASPVFQSKSALRGARGMPSYSISTAFPEPWPGGWWRLRDVVDYQKSSCLSLFTLAARYHDMFQGNYLQIGRGAIERGLSEPPFAWLVPSNQRDPATALKMLDLLHATGIEVHQATEPFAADGVSYPEGTYILYCAQPYRAHLKDMMERQEYPNRVQFPGGPAEAPYDIAGWTLPLQMGVRHIPVASPFECANLKLNSIPKATSTVDEDSEAASYAVELRGNDDYRLLNRLHKNQLQASIRTTSASETSDENSITSLSSITTLVIHDGSTFRAQKKDLLDGIGVTLVGIPKTDEDSASHLRKITPARTGLYQPWTASMDEGWTRLVLEDFEFPYRSVHNADIRAGNLNQRYDCLVIPSMSPAQILEGRTPDTTEPAYVGGIGKEGVVALQEFVSGGGALVCIDEASNLPIDYFNIPVRNLIRGRSSQDFFCPGSLLRVSIDSKHPLGFGMPSWFSGYFRRSQAFELVESSGGAENSRNPAQRFPATVVARYSDTVLLESGWIRGGDLIIDKPAIVEVEFGKGHVVLLGFRVQHRAQPHGTFRLLFNAIQRSTFQE